MAMQTMRLFNRTETCEDGSTYRHPWHECQPFHQIILAYRCWTLKGWHPEKRRLAHLRAFYWTVFRLHETELCCRCGGPVSVVFHVPDDLWMQHCGFPHAPHGVLCVRCITKLAKANGVSLFWSCGAGVFPSCSGNPCAHEESMMEVARQRDELWRDGCDSHPVVDA
jgi:hypothetical protein